MGSAVDRPTVNTEVDLGLNVYGKLVQVDQTHQKLVNTSTTDNPSSVTLEDDFVVHHIFTRSKTHKHDGDGNPLIYAMKGLHGFNMQPMYRTQLMTASGTIIGSMELSRPAGLVMPVPSSNGFAGEIAAIVAEVFGAPLAEAPALRKRTIGEMLEAYGDQIPDLSKTRTETYKQTIGLWRKANQAKTFSMKEVDNSIRDCFDPLTTTGDLSHIEGQCVVLVDDLMSSGTTIVSAARLLRAAGAHTIGVCFLSALPGGR